MASSGTIYILRNRLNGKCYVGQTLRSFSRRLAEHRCGKQLVDKSLRKHGDDAFEKVILRDIPRGTEAVVGESKGRERRMTWREHR